MKKDKKTKNKKVKDTKKASKTKNKSSKKIVSRIINILSIIVLGLFLYKVYKLDMIPMKYYKVGAIALIVLELIYTLLCINKKKTGKLLVIFNIFAVLFMIGELFGVWYIDKTVNFLQKNLMKDYEIDEYYVVANAKSTIKSIKELDGETIYYSVDTDNYKELKEALKKKTTAKIEKVDTLSDSLMKLDYPENAILINSGTFDSLIENDPVYDEHTKIIDTIKISIKKKQKKESDIDITSESFIIYLSGIDTRGNTLVKKSLSDVNMLITVNPKTKTILLVSIPRDSYVQLHGYSGKKDKLTHAGSLGGVELSKATVEDMMDVHADYYARVNFKAVINLVNAVGGVDVYEEHTKQSFRLWTNRTCVIQPGENHLYGDCALAFARERYHYSDGDMQRNRNQQMVLKALFNRITSSADMVANYSKLLNAVDGTFETDMSQEDIAALIKFQLNDMSAWKFESQNVTGGTGRTTTYSSGSTELSVVYPTQESINAAKEAIKKVYNGEPLEDTTTDTTTTDSTTTKTAQ